MDFENILAKRWNEILSISSYFFDIHTAAFMDPFSIYEFTSFYRARVRHADFTLLRFYRFTARGFAAQILPFYGFTVLPRDVVINAIYGFTVLPFYRAPGRREPRSTEPHR